jgi:hypothetical protein
MLDIAMGKVINLLTPTLDKTGDIFGWGQIIMSASEFSWNYIIYVVPIVSYFSKKSASISTFS